MKLFFNLFALFFLLFPCLAYADEYKETALERFLDGFQSFQADFRQTLTNEKGEVLEISSGVVYMQNPGKFRWIYNVPYTQYLIADGEALWLYDVELEQVTVRDVATSLDNTPAAIISGQSPINEYFREVELGNIEGYDWIELQPRDEENQYSKVRLGFNADQLGMMILFDNLGQVTRIDFINPLRNTSLDSGLFTFKAPQGVDVIDERQSAQ